LAALKGIAAAIDSMPSNFATAESAFAESDGAAPGSLAGPLTVERALVLLEDGLDAARTCLLPRRSRVSLPGLSLGEDCVEFRFVSFDALVVAGVRGFLVAIGDFLFAGPAALCAGRAK
jgi:hypothetical protein